MPIPEGVSSDTTYYSYPSFNNNCDAFPDDKVRNIGLIINNKLGWVKFAIFEEYKILLLSSGIQQN